MLGTNKLNNNLNRKLNSALAQFVNAFAFYRFQQRPSSLVKRSIAVCFVNHHLQSMPCALNKSLVINHLDVHRRWIIKVPKLCQGKYRGQKSSVHSACQLNIS